MSTGNSIYDREEPFRHPLGLPSGSVRALLTLMIVAVACTDLVRTQTVTLIWAETLMIALAHYFTTRRFVRLPPATLKDLEAKGIIEPEPYPLYLPRGTIRTLILVAFIAVGIYLWRNNKIWPTQENPDADAVAILGTLLAYFVGNTLRAVRTWWNGGIERPPSRTWGDLKATVVLVGLLITGGLHILAQKHHLPAGVEHIVMAMVLFYFGSR